MSVCRYGLDLIGNHSASHDVRSVWLRAFLLPTTAHALMPRRGRRGGRRRLRLRFGLARYSGAMHGWLVEVNLGTERARYLPCSDTGQQLTVTFLSGFNFALWALLTQVPYYTEKQTSSFMRAVQADSFGLAGCMVSAARLVHDQNPRGPEFLRHPPGLNPRGTS